MRVNNAKMYIKMIALGWTSKCTLQPAILTVSAYNPYKPSFICLRMAKEVSFYIQEVSVLHKSLTAVYRLSPVLWLQRKGVLTTSLQCVQTHGNMNNIRSSALIFNRSLLKATFGGAKTRSQYAHCAMGGWQHYSSLNASSMHPIRSCTKIHLCNI